MSCGRLGAIRITNLQTAPRRFAPGRAMTSRVQTMLLAGLLAATTSAIYLWNLPDAPTYLTRDETFVGLSGYSLAANGRDVQGELMPLYFRSPVDGNWWAPILPYAIAGMLKLVPLTEGSVRAPMAIAAVINVVLVFFIGRLLFDRQLLAVVPAVLLALSPSHVIENRYANDPGLPSTFALGWMLAMMVFVQRGNPGALFVAGAMLGLGFYSYVGAVPLMPLFALFTLAVLAIRRVSITRALIFAAGCVIPVALGVPWLANHPDVFHTTFLHYQDAQFRNADAATAVRWFASLERAVDIGFLYVDFWNPRFLFVDGAHTVVHSTGRAGVFLVSLAGLLLVGAVRAARSALSDTRALLLLGAFLIAPIPASLVDINDHLARHAIWRAVAVVPFGALLTGLGLEYVLTGKNARLRLLALCVAVAIPAWLIAQYRQTLPNAQALLMALIALPTLAAVSTALFWVWKTSSTRTRPRVPGRRQLIAVSALIALGAISLAQFRDFYSDYLDDFRLRFDLATDGNMRGILEEVIDRSPVVQASQHGPIPTVYLGFQLGPGDWGSNYWRFYVHKHHREDLLLRSVVDIGASRFQHDMLCHLAPDSIVTTRVGWDPKADALIDRMLKAGELMFVSRPRRRPVYWLMRTNGTCKADELG